MTKVDRGYTGSDDSKGVGHIVGLMNKDFFDRLTKIIIGRDTFKLKETDDKALAWSINTNYNSGLEIMNLLLDKCDLSQRNPQIYLRIDDFKKGVIDTTPFLGKYVKHLYIGGDRYNRYLGYLVKASAEFPHCPTLTHLTMQWQDIGSSISPVLRRAIKSGKLPRLRRVTIIKCREQEKRSDWPEQVEVTMTDDENEAKLLKMFKSDEIESSNSNCYHKTSTQVFPLFQPMVVQLAQLVQTAQYD